MKKDTYVIVGGSAAGASAAIALRKEGFDGRVVLIGEEPELPYERPELSKKYLRAEPDVDLLVKPQAHYAEAGIELLTGERVERVDVPDRNVVLGSKTIGFDRLLIATGAAPRHLAVPGADLEGVATLRTMTDADRIRERGLEAESVVVVGGGWIGAEVAASLRQLGRLVSLVVPRGLPLEHVLGPEVAAVYGAAHVKNGVRLVTRTKVVGFSGTDRVTGVQTEDGQTLPADLVVVGIGAEPRTELAEQAGIEVDNGILVNELLETSVPGIFAAGDVANAAHPIYGQRLRVEHIDNAKKQGRAAAANMLGAAKPYARFPFFYSDQYDLGMEYTGYAPTWDEVVFRGDPKTNEFISFWLRDRRVAAAMHMNIWDAQPALQAIVAAREIVTSKDLADPRRPLDELVSAAKAPTTK